MALETAPVLNYIEFFLALNAIVATAELLQVRCSLRDEGLLSWRVRRLSHPAITRAIATARLEKFFSYPGVLLLIGLRIGGAILLIFAICFHRPVLIPLLLVAVTTVYFTLRNAESNDGSDQMAAIATITCVLAELSGTNFGRAAAIAFLAFQTALAYGTSGVLKVQQRGWRDGSFVLDILKTSSFGNRDLLKFVKEHIALAAILGCAVAFGDCLLALTPVLPPTGCVTLLCLGVVGHGGIAFVLGLNTFVWSFLATYPAIFWISSSIYK